MQLKIEKDKSNTQGHQLNYRLQHCASLRNFFTFVQFRHSQNPPVEFKFTPLLTFKAPSSLLAQLIIGHPLTHRHINSVKIKLMYHPLL
jgi:hypothetical protein